MELSEQALEQLKPAQGQRSRPRQEERMAARASVLQSMTATISFKPAVSWLFTWQWCSTSPVYLVGFSRTTMRPPRGTFTVLILI